MAVRYRVVRFKEARRVREHPFATVICGECRNYRAGRRDPATMRQMGRCKADGKVVDRCHDCVNGKAELL